MDRKTVLGNLFITAVNGTAVGLIYGCCYGLRSGLVAVALFAPVCFLLLLGYDALVRRKA